MDKLTLLIGGVLVAGVAAFVYNLNQQPSGHSMTPPDTSMLSAGDPIAEVRLPAEFSPLAASGKTAFDTKCAACHGTDATGLEGSAPPLVHKIYEPSHHSDEAFFLAVQNGVRAHHWRFGNMPPVEGLTRGNVKGIVAYVRELQRENGIN
ncbi:cytochrome c [Ruegeria sediminis]|uniref:Cytochrome c n=1 Tax=Ruegeria sediminis TaxID=2583820 RepID=A0ABY2X5Z2_9RHOB|nr:cytochrome c [Ruegeria sediminis]TMV10389.1 cytochrome c [Ruegeria sediminis]